VCVAQIANILYTLRWNFMKPVKIHRKKNRTSSKLLRPILRSAFVCVCFFNVNFHSKLKKKALSQNLMRIITENNDIIKERRKQQCPNTLC